MDACCKEGLAGTSSDPVPYYIVYRTVTLGFSSPTAGGGSSVCGSSAAGGGSSVGGISRHYPSLCMKAQCQGYWGGWGGGGGS